MPEKITIYTDGGSRANPGPAAAAFVLLDENNNQLQAKALFLGSQTNNVAEYTAVVKALEAAKQAGAKEITVFSDSELLVKQINGLYKVKNPNLKPLFQKTISLLDNFEVFSFKHIPRSKNQQADRLVNQALNLERDINSSVDEQAKITDQSSKRKNPIRLGVLISGGGRTLINILEYIKKGKLNAEIPLVISSRSTVAGVERAKAAGLNVKIIRKKDYPDIDEFSKEILNQLHSFNIELVIQGGWLCLWKIPSQYDNRVINIHPALLPSFGGKGMYGHHVHEAVLKAGCKVSGCTVHFCTNVYDKGPIIVQRCCPVEDEDDADTLAARVFEQECIAYPQAIKLFAENKLLIVNKRVKIIE